MASVEGRVLQEGDQMHLKRSKTKQLSSNSLLMQFGNTEFDGALNYTQLSEYKLGKLLGQGGFAIVREAVHISTGHRVAIKIYDKYKLNKNL
jgi:serine/threonine protein kinase